MIFNLYPKFRLVGNYNPLIGRFLSADSLVPGYENPQNLNRYSYALGNPVRFTDPTGHYVFEEEPDDSAIWQRDKPAGYGNVLIRGQYGSFTEKRPVTGWDIVRPAAALYGTAIGAVAAEAAFVDIGWSGVSSIWNWGKNLLFPACAAGYCGNRVSTLVEADLPAIERFAQEAEQINKVERGYGSFGNLWTYIAKSADPTRVFLSRVGGHVTGMMKVNPTEYGYEIKYLEGTGNGAGTALFRQALQDSIAKGYGGSVYLFPTEKAASWYLTNFPGAQEMPNGALYWSSQVAQTILTGQ